MKKVLSILLVICLFSFLVTGILSAEPEVKQKELLYKFIPFDEIGKLLNNSGNKYIGIKLKEFYELYKKAYNKSKKEEEKPTYTISKIKLNCNAHKDIVFINAKYYIHTFKDWQRIPLVEKNFCPIYVKVNEKEDEKLLYNNDFAEIVIEKKGVYQIELFGGIPTSEEKVYVKNRKFQLGFPIAPIISGTLSLEKATTLNIDNSILNKVNDYTYKFHLKGSSILTAKWVDYLEDEPYFKNIEKTEKKEKKAEKKKVVKKPRKLRIHSKLFRLFVLHSDRMNEYTFVKLWEEKGMNRFAIEIPGNVDIISVKSQKRFEKFIEEKSGKQILNIQYKNQIKMDYLFIKLSRKLPENLELLEIKDIKPLNVITDQGNLAFISLINQEFNVQSVDKLFEIDDKELPYKVNAISSLPMIASYKYNSHPYSLKVKIKKVFNVETTKNSVVNDLWYKTVVSKKGEFFTTVQYHIHTNTGEPLKIKFSNPGTKIDSCIVNGRRINPSKTADPGEYIINYPNKDWKKSRYKVELAYFYNTSTLSRIGKMQIQYPTLNMDILKKNYCIYLPQKYHLYGWDDSQLQQNESTYKKSSFLAIPLTIRTYFLGEFGEIWYVWLFIMYFIFVIIYRVIKTRKEREIEIPPLEETLKKAKNNGISCLPIIVLIIVMGILAAISVPNFNSSRKKARSKACVANIKMLENALEMYDMDNPPKNSWQTTVVPGSGNNVNHYPLLRGGYVQRWPKCPVTNKCDYRVYRKGSIDNYALYVECKVHGTIENLKTGATVRNYNVSKSMDKYYPQESKQQMNMPLKKFKGKRNIVQQKEIGQGFTQPQAQRKSRTKKGSLSIGTKVVTKGKKNIFYSLFNLKNKSENIVVKYMDNKSYYFLSFIVFLLTLIFIYFVYKHKQRPRPTRFGIVLMSFLGLFIFIFYIGILEIMVFYAFFAAIMSVLVKYCWNFLAPYVNKKMTIFLLLMALPGLLFSGGRYSKNTKYSKSKTYNTKVSNYKIRKKIRIPKKNIIKRKVAKPVSFEIFIPYKNANNFLNENFTDETVFLNFDLYRSLMNKVLASENEINQFFETFPYCVGGIKTEAWFEKTTLHRKDIVKIRVVTNGNVYIFKENTKIYLPGSLIIGYQSVRLNGKKVPIFHDEYDYYILVSNTGEHNFEIKYYDSVPWSDGDGQYELFTFGNAFFSKLLVVEFTNFTGLVPELENGIIMKKSDFPEKKKSGFQAYCSLYNSHGKEMIKWKQSRVVEKVVKPNIKVKIKKLKQRIKVKHFNNVMINENLIDLYTRIEFNIENEGLNELILSVQDPMYKIISLDGSHIHDWNQEVNGDVKITFQNPVSGRYTLDIQSQKLYEISKDNRWSDVVPYIVDKISKNVLKREFFIGIETAPDLEFEAEEVSRVKELGYGEIPKELKAMVQDGLVKNYYFEDRYRKIPFKIAKTETVEMEPININSMEITSYLLDKGREMRTIRLKIQNNSKQFLKLDLKSGSKVWSVWTSDGTINPYYRTEKKKSVYIPLKKSRVQGQNLVSYNLYIAIFVENQKVDSWLNMMNLRSLHTPAIDATISKTRWNIYTLKNKPIIDFTSDDFNEYSDEKVESIGTNSSGNSNSFQDQKDPQAARKIISWYKSIMMEEKNYSRLPIKVNFSFFEGFTVSAEQSLNQQGSSGKLTLFLLNSRFKKLIAIFVFFLGILMSPFLIKMLKLEFDKLSFIVAVVAALLYRVIEIYNTYVYDHFIAGIIFGFLIILFMNIVSRIFEQDLDNRLNEEQVKK